MSDLSLYVTTDENERQLERHGLTAFPTAFYHRNLISNTVVWHWHDELELNLTLSGTMVVGAGGTAVTLSAGDGCFIKVFCTTSGKQTMPPVNTALWYSIQD